MKKFSFLVVLFLFGILNVNAQFTLDNMESYGGGNAPIFGGKWSSWGGSNADAILSSANQAQSGGLSGYVDGSTVVDGLLLFGNKIFGSWGVKYSMYIPSGKVGYWNLQGTEAPGLEFVVGNIYMGNSGIGGDDEMTGRIDYSTADETDDTVFQFPKDQWFDITMNFDFNAGAGASTWQMWVFDGSTHVEVVPAGSAYADGAGTPPSGLGAIDFYSISADNEYYLDDVEMINAFYPNPNLGGDNIDPTAVCQNITVQLDNNGFASINGVNIDGGSTDNVGIVSYTAVPNTFSCNDLGANAVTLIVADAAGNTDTCTAIVTVQDNLDPNVIGQNATGSLNGTGTVTIPVSSVNNGSTDNCTLASLTLTPNTFTSIGTYPAVLEGTDTSGNSDDVTVIITITDTVDNVDPTAICQNITVQLNNSGTAVINGNSIDGGSFDNIGIVSYTAVPDSFNCSNLGTNAVTLIVADAAGNTDTCVAIVTVEDNLNPNVIGQNATGNLNGTGSVTIPVSSVDAGSTDNCGIANLTLTPNTFTNVGTYAAVLEGTDTSGNSGFANVTITIIDTVDNIDPIAVCQNITVQLNNSGTVVINGNSIDGGSTDNIGIVSYTAVPNTFNCSNIGTNAVTLLVADAAGNTDTCIAIVTVEDNLIPNVIGQNAEGNLNGTGTVTIPVSSVDLGSTDNCSIANLTLTPNTFTSVGTYVAVLEGTDPSGNSDDVSVVITIIDDILNTLEQEFTDFSMYPNPANTTITIDGGENTLVKRLEVFDITGKRIITKKIEQPTQKLSLDISSLESSVYFVSIIDVNDKKIMRKLIKE